MIQNALFATTEKTVRSYSSIVLNANKVHGCFGGVKAGNKPKFVLDRVFKTFGTKSTLLPSTLDVTFSF